MPFLPRRLLAIAFATAALLVPAAAWSQLVRMDSGGAVFRDGIARADHPNLRPGRLAHSRRIRDHDPLVAIVTADVDHDGDLDIVATTAHNRLRIWMNQGHGQFRILHPRRRLPRTRPKAVLRRLAPGVPSDELCDGCAIGLSPHLPAAGRSSASALLTPGTSTPAVRRRSRGSVPRGPPSAAAFS